MMKTLMMRRFAKAMAIYETEAVAQRQICENLIAKISSVFHTFTPKILELGCGTGQLSRLLMRNLIPAELIVNDICEEAAIYFANSQRTVFLAGDAEKISFPEALDLVASASAMQWFKDPEKLLEKIANALNPKGFVAIATFGKENLKEVKKVTGSGLPYMTDDSLRTIFEKDFDILIFEDGKITLTFPDAKRVLYHLKNTGVTGVSKASIWTRQNIKTFEENYTKDFSCPGGVQLTYHPIYIIGQKR